MHTTIFTELLPTMRENNPSVPRTVSIWFGAAAVPSVATVGKVAVG